ncbi:amino acid permease [Paenibacillus macquariensis]|uniref:Amino acid transporter, AAT family n=1 Tax=Paenibacillus macquariensis TaxID=948756 RepID=A0ABY1KBT7_9BACL|nr:amino acid permease [Paenibacillus macquariensis]MEC0093544.1 amino acid permease [Paenibacillus macquariensis]OAB29848.1 amino acid permease [Paenibacillus macquariensis subsp. macquariensis]SIR56690.1 amino acid transporter, AAT family [Paenibacillus macquariensis]
MENDNQKLQRTMTSRHITMMALGGAIGAGLFKGSSAAIDMAGPSVIIAYLLGGIILLFVMQGLAEMAVRNSDARTFRDLVQSILGKYPAYFLDWIYWKMWVLNIAAESVVAAIFLQYWLPDYPIWILALSVSILVTAINLLSVKVFAETEYWLALIKITVIVVFIIAGLALLLVTLGNHTAVGFSNLTDHGGFLPNGPTGLITAMLVVIYSYGGTEIIGITLAETKNPEKVVPKAVRSTLVRIISFYLLPFLIIVSLIPWNEVNGVPESPFVMVFKMIGIPGADHIMNAVVLLAIISSMNSGLYGSSRVLYTQAVDGRIPRIFAHLSKKKVPVYAILMCTLALYMGVIISLFAGSKTFDFLMGSLGYTVLFIWLIIAVAHLKSRKKNPERTSVYVVKWFPYTTWAAIIALSAILIGIIFTTSIIVTGITLAIYIFITLTYIYKGRFHEDEAK